MSYLKNRSFLCNSCLSKTNDGDFTLMKDLGSDGESENESALTNQEFSPLRLLGQGLDDVCSIYRTINYM